MDSLTLNVPFEGEVPAPSTNYHGTPDALHAYGPYLMGVTGLFVTRDMLEVVLGRRDQASSVSFALTQLGTK
jgi:hypothetical protein